MMARYVSTVVEHFPHHPKAKDLSTTVVAVKKLEIKVQKREFFLLMFKYSLYPGFYKYHM
jgi:hypothetical protein